MYSPFFTNHRTYHPFYPVYHAGPATEEIRPTEISAAPKVVRIPVESAGSERLGRAEAAAKIQKVLRGFLARKSLRKVRDVEIEVDRIAERLNRRETVELLKSDAKERLRMSESLMALLLRLDSIRGVDLGVRARRKAAIRKAIGLQERIDAIVAGESESDGDAAENRVDLKDSRGIESGGGEIEAGENCADAEESRGGGGVEAGENCADMEESREMERGVEDEGEVRVSGETERDLLEKMVRENEKMMGMMSELFERSEAQTRMLNALTQRVGMLERVIACDRMRKKKKMKKATPLPCTQN